jgi:hypothetical protein
MLIVVFVEFTFLIDYTPRNNFHQSSSSSCLSKSSSDNNIILYTVHHFYAEKQILWKNQIFFILGSRLVLDKYLWKRYLVDFIEYKSGLILKCFIAIEK